MLRREILYYLYAYALTLDFILTQATFYFFFHIAYNVYPSTQYPLFSSFQRSCWTMGELQCVCPGGIGVGVKLMIYLTRPFKTGSLRYVILHVHLNSKSFCCCVDCWHQASHKCLQVRTKAYERVWNISFHPTCSNFRSVERNVAKASNEYLTFW